MLGAQNDVPWQLEKGVLEELYTDTKSLLNQKMTYSLRLQKIDHRSRQFLFYDHKGNPLLLNASLFYYNAKILERFNFLRASAWYKVEFIFLGKDLQNRAFGKLLNLQRDVLKDF